jgi:hypothetical protein
VMQAFPFLLLQVFVNQFVFIWGHKQCIRALSQFIVGTYYYFKDLNSVYAFHVEGYLMGWKMKCYSLMMSQARPFEIPNVAISSLSILKDVSCQKIKSNG